MSGEGYTPSTGMVRRNFALGLAYKILVEKLGAEVRWAEAGVRLRAKADFDRWLVSERARIWDEAVSEIDSACSGSHVGMVANPYRKGGHA